MKKIIRLIVILLFCCFNMQSQESKTALALFQKVQNAMHKHYIYLDKNGIFEDPLGRIDYYFKTIQKIAPELLCNTFQYKDELVNILIGNTPFKKNVNTDLDIEYLLCNTTIEEYVDVLNNIYSMYKHNLIDFQRFDSFLFQDFNVSNSVVKNYQNEKLMTFLDILLQDEELMKLPRKYSNLSFKESVMGLRDGSFWDDGSFEKIRKIQPPILETLNIECE